MCLSNVASTTAELNPLTVAADLDAAASMCRGDQAKVAAQMRAGAAVIRDQRAYNECGHADWRKCQWCGKYEPPHKLRFSGIFAYHRECNNANARRVRERKKMGAAA